MYPKLPGMRGGAHAVIVIFFRHFPLIIRPLTPVPPLLALFCCLPFLLRAEIASEGLKGRVFEFSLGDLNNDEDLVSRFIVL